MKKILISTMALCLALCVSCKKDSDNGGSVSPTIKKTLSKLYLTYSYKSYISFDNINWELDDHEEYDHVLNTEYIYNGDKLSETIKYFNNGDINTRDTITYSENGLITNITEYNTLSEDNWVLSYDNGLLTKADQYSNGLMTSSFDYSYTDNRLTKVIYTSSDYVYTYEITWTGDNVTQTKGIIGDWEYITTYNYDDKINPYKEIPAFETLSIVFTDFAALSKNNVISRSTNMLENTSFTYQYDGDYPSETEFSIEDSFNYGYMWFKSITTYHHYLTYLQ